MITQLWRYTGRELYDDLGPASVLETELLPGTQAAHHLADEAWRTIGRATLARV